MLVLMPATPGTLVAVFKINDGNEESRSRVSPDETNPDGKR